MRTVWRPAACLLSACLLLSVAGCITGREYAEEYGSVLETGMTMGEVQARLGEPQQVITGDPGTDTYWIYRYEGGPTTALVVIMVIFIVVLIVALVLSKSKGSGGGGVFFVGGGASDPPYEFSVRFDPEGRLVEVSHPYPTPGE